MGGDQSSSWQLLPNLDPRVWTQTLAIGERGRVTMPPPLRSRLPWIGTGGTFLGTMGADGSIRIRPWEGDGERAHRLVAERYALLPSDRKEEFALSVMDRYLRLTGERGGRLTLPAVVRTQIDPQGRGFLRAVVRDDSLLILDDDSWQRGRAARISELERLGLA